MNSMTSTKKSLKEVIFELFVDENPKPLAQALGWSKDQLELLYSHGYQLFQSGKYNNALTFFKQLRELDPTSYRYAYSIAVTYHHMKDFEKATSYYLASMNLSPNEPEPYFYLFDCFSKTNNNEMAKFMLQEVLSVTEKQPKYRVLREKAKIELDKIK
jgi:type III secretion system low calcium response chaperone LcrH/SycD